MCVRSAPVSGSAPARSRRLRRLRQALALLRCSRRLAVGALALALATEVPHAIVYGVEKSPDAFIWAKGNAEFVGATNARIVRGDLDTALPDLNGTVDVVVSNPPYVPDDAIPRDPEVRFHDPEAALYGGPDGLDVVRDIVRAAPRLLRVGGMRAVWLEVDSSHPPLLRKWLEEGPAGGAGLRFVRWVADFGGHPRFCELRLVEGAHGP